MVEKKIRKELRVNKLISKNNRLLVIDSLTEKVLKDVLKDLPVTIIKKSFPVNNKIFENKKLKEFVKANKINKIVIPWSGDDELDYFIDGFFRGKGLKYLGHTGKFVKLFRPVFDKDIVKLAKSKNIIFKPKKHDKFVEKVASKYDFAKNGLLNSIGQIKKFL
ncbi:hypothetical protein ACFLZ7_00495 [Nanoarchaeota archaeon]